MQKHCSRWTSSLELSAEGAQTSELVTELFQTITENVCIWSVGLKCSLNPNL